MLSIKFIYAFKQTYFYSQSNVNMITIKYYLIHRLAMILVNYLSNV